MMVMAHNEIKSQCVNFLLAFSRCASCQFITSNFSEIAFRLSASVSVTVSPSSVLTGVSSASDIEINISASGTDSPVSLS